MKKEGTQFTITGDNLTTFLGKHIFSSDRMYEETPPGVVMGLAWTAMGGSSLYIETAARRSTKLEKDEDSSGSIHITGNLGTVMKESAQIALTVARNFMRNSNADSAFLERGWAILKHLLVFLLCIT